MSLSRPLAKFASACTDGDACLQRILAQLRQEDNEVQHIDALGQLCELLSVSTEESLSMLPVESLAPILVSNQIRTGPSHTALSPQSGQSVLHCKQNLTMCRPVRYGARTANHVSGQALLHLPLHHYSEPTHRSMCRWTC